MEVCLGSRMEEIEKVRLKKLIEELGKIRGKHTELISIYVPADYSIEKVREQVFQEISTAQNIKSKTTRKNVLAALEKILQELKLYKKTPPNGMVIFCGNVSQEEGKADYKIWVIEPPEKLSVKLYRCDQEFVLGPLKEMLEVKYNYGLIVIDNSGCAIGILRGKNIECIKERKSIVPGKTRKGGQSAVRFERVRENLARDWYKSVAEDVREIFKKYEIKGILLGGPGPTKETFLEYLHPDLKKKIIAIRDTGYSDEYGLRELVEKSLDSLRKEEIYAELNILKTFFERIGKGSELVTYGIEEVKNALLSGAVDKLLISEEIDKKVLEELYKLGKRQRVEIFLISTGTQEGKQFKEFCGVGALLKFPIS